MEIRLWRLMCELSLWLSAELILGYIEMDNVADYCEFLKRKEAITLLEF